MRVDHTETRPGIDPAGRSARPRQGLQHYDLSDVVSAQSVHELTRLPFIQASLGRLLASDFVEFDGVVFSHDELISLPEGGASVNLTEHERNLCRKMKIFAVVKKSSINSLPFHIDP